MNNNKEQLYHLSIAPVELGLVGSLIDLGK